MLHIKNDYGLDPSDKILLDMAHQGSYYAKSTAGTWLQSWLPDNPEGSLFYR